MVGLTDPRFAEKRVQRWIFGLQQFLIFSNGRSLLPFPYYPFGEVSILRNMIESIPYAHL
jgi:hypothetical protein